MQQYDLTTSHLALAHKLWRAHLKAGDAAVDATCGNGHDTLMLTKLLPDGKVYAFDIQPQAIENTRERLKDFPNCHFFCQSHAAFPLECAESNLFVYNLGYLPKGDMGLTTQTDTTLQSIQSALTLLAVDGMISITCYPGHEEGAKEEEAILLFLRALTGYSIDYYKSNRALAPSLLIIQKTK